MQMNSSPVKVKEKVESRLMSEMRQHLVEMNRKKMLDRGLISERELAIIGQLTFTKGDVGTLRHHMMIGLMN